jgi:two-component system, cell cycle sensor histidine kinase and response regulator CckA
VLYYPSATPFLGRFLGPDLLTFSIVPLFERCVVLVADDEPGILRLASHALTRHGYIVIPASDGLSALRACQERDGPIHLALLDIMMPGMSGPELFECLKEIRPNVAVLFMSGYMPDAIAEIQRDTKTVDFIAKPFLPRDLVQRVNEILGNSEVCTLLDDEPDGTHA